MNSIPADQVTAQALSMLAAQRRLYSRAKLIHGCQIVVVTAIPTAWYLAALKWSILNVWGAFWGLIALAAQLLLTRWKKRLITRAAKIQELFDCRVLQLPWKELKLGSKHEQEAIAQDADIDKAGSVGKIEDWYPAAVGALPLDLARIVCQRANCWWDANLRRRYAHWVLSAAIALAAGAAAFFLLKDTPSPAILLGLAPLAPLLWLGINEYLEQTEAAARLDTLRQHAEQIWDEALASPRSADRMLALSRDLQDEIYENRRSNVPIFDWVYKKLRRPFEDAMNAGAADLIEKARSAADHKDNTAAGPKDATDRDGKDKSVGAGS